MDKRTLFIFIILVYVLASLSKAFAVDFNQEQIDNLEYAYAYGTNMHNDGYQKDKEMGYIYAALVWKESSAGIITNEGPEHQAYGLFQNYLPTLRARVKQEGLDIEDKYIADAVSKNKGISAKYAKIELKYWLSVRNGNIRQALASYNAGWNWRRSVGYADDVLKKARYLKEQNLFAGI